VTPELTLGEIARVAVALPFVVEAVRVEGDLYVDGGVVDGFPAEPLETDDGFDHVFGMNVLLPPGLEGERISGWESRSTGVLDASRQLQVANHLELARRSRRRLGDKLTLIEPVDYSELRGAAFYDLFLDRRQWPRLMRQGYDATVEALRRFRRRSVNSRTRSADKGRGNSAR
jgi:predicted acylesterase/phospholipase RssA